MQSGENKVTASDSQEDAISLNGDRDQRNGDDGDDHGVDLTVARWLRFRINRKLAAPFAREMADKSGWAMLAIAFVIVFLGLCFGITMILEVLADRTLWTP